MSEYGGRGYGRRRHAKAIHYKKRKHCPSLLQGQGIPVPNAGAVRRFWHARCYSFQDLAGCVWSG
eukprot:10584255-Karenia_brevis.AAC.1